eukprot:7122705-Alexandrium_andersonii.AAC.1
MSGPQRVQAGNRACAGRTCAMSTNTQPKTPSERSSRVRDGGKLESGPSPTVQLGMHSKPTRPR